MIVLVPYLCLTPIGMYFVLYHLGVAPCCYLNFVYLSPLLLVVFQSSLHESHMPEHLCKLRKNGIVPPIGKDLTWPECIMMRIKCVSHDLLILMNHFFGTWVRVEYPK